MSVDPYVPAGLTDAWWREIAAQAAAVDERLQGPYIPAGDAGAEARLEAWRKAAARGDSEALRHRMAWDGFTEADVLPYLGDVSLAGHAPLPDWISVLAGVSEQAMELPPGSDAWQRETQEILSTAPPPFADVLAPFVLVARRRLNDRAGEMLRLLAPAARGALESTLLQALSRTAAETLMLEFGVMRSGSQSSLDRLFVQIAQPESRDTYDIFVGSLLAAGLAPLFARFPVLGRILATTVTHYLSALTEFLGHLSADLPALAATFAAGHDLGRVSAIEPSLSDPHHGQKSVLALTFESGTRLVYKPKSLGMEVAYARLLEWLNQQGAPLPFKTPIVTDRGSHGWVEFIDHRPCEDVGQASRYFRRAGMLLALFHALDVTDCHRENLIAQGEHPVLIDMETMMQPRAVTEGGPSAEEEQNLAVVAMQDSVLRTGLLPMWHVNADERVAYDASGLGAAWEQEVPFRISDWQYVNTDAMRLGHRSGVMRPGPNVARLGGEMLRLAAFQEELVLGFEQMYRFLLQKRDELLTPGGPVDQLAQQPVRFIFRSTRNYYLIQKQAMRPSRLRFGADWSIEFELLSRAAIATTAGARSGQRSIFWPVYRAERRALLEGDIPHFSARAVDDSLLVEGERIEGCFVEPSMARVRRRLLDMDEADLRLQEQLIRGSIYALEAHEPVTLPGPAAAAEGSATGLLSREQLQAEALRLAEDIERHALIAERGGASWIAPRLLGQTQRYQLLPTGMELYEGAAGIALFLAAVSATTGGQYRDLAMRALIPLRRALREPERPPIRHMPLGGAGGLASILYSLVRLAPLLEEPDLLQDAIRVMRLITPARIAADTHLDVLAGAAGAILGLAVLAADQHNDEAVERAQECARHLLATRQPGIHGLHAWPTYGDLMLTGFSHGAAGNAYALTRLYRLTGQAELRDAAREAIAYEDALFSSQEGNWPDLRHKNGFMSSWCHGAAGIGLARVGGLSVLDDDEIRRDITVALGTMLKQGTDGIETVCCGAIGRIEIAHTVGLALGRPDLIARAQEGAATVVHRAAQRPYLLHPLMPSGIFVPGFFQGLSGIGYTLLRLAYPDRLPSVLLWE